MAQRIVELVKAGDVDFGIGSVIRGDREIVTEPLWVDGIWIFTARNHELAARAWVRLADLSKIPLIMTARDSSVRRLFEKAADRAGLAFSPIFETHYMSTALALARAGLGAAVLPESASQLADAGAMVGIPIRRPPIERKILLIRKMGRTLPRAAALLVEGLRTANMQ